MKCLFFLLKNIIEIFLQNDNTKEIIIILILQKLHILKSNNQIFWHFHFVVMHNIFTMKHFLEISQDHVFVTRDTNSGLQWCQHAISNLFVNLLKHIRSVTHM